MLSVICHYPCPFPSLSHMKRSFSPRWQQCAWIINRSTSCANSPIQQDENVGWGNEAFIPSLLEVVCVIMQMRQAKCMQERFAMSGCRGKVDSWGNWDSPLGCIGRAMLWEEHASLQLLGTSLASDVWFTAPMSLLLQHLYLNFTPYFFIPLPVSFHYTCVFNVIASFTFLTTEPITFLIFPCFLLICITDMFVF